MRTRPAAVLALSFGLGAVEALGQTCPRIELQPLLDLGPTSPTLVTHAGDGTGRLFVVEQAGNVKVLQPGAASPTVFLSIPSAKVLSGGERGLLGLAFHPEYESNRRLFVYYTRKPDGATVIAEYKASPEDPDVADPTATTATETVLLSFAQPFSNHNGGSIIFGPDGFLYIASGDGGDANDPGNRAQNIGLFLGKILRIDVDSPEGAALYSSPPDNPYAGATPGLDEIFAIGLRNPWRMSFDRSTGQLLAGDVGQGSREEVDLIELGGNYGWRVMEGTRCNIATDAFPCNSPAFTPPALEYSQAGDRCAVTAGHVYRGTSGALADGTYVYGDYCTGEIFGIDVADLPLSPSDLPIVPTLLRDSSLLLSSFGEDEEGEIYAVGLGGEVRRLLAAVRISPLSAAFEGEGGDGIVDVTSPVGCSPWTAVSNDPWIVVESGEGGTGNGAVDYRVAPNPDVPPRRGTLTIASRTFTVEQEGGQAPTLSIDDAVVTEGPGAQASFTVSLSFASPHPVSVRYTTANGTATESDFVAASLETLAFDPGSVAESVIIEVKEDLLDEDVETFVVNLSEATNSTIEDGEGVGTIADDDPLPALSVADRSFAERNGWRVVPFLVTLSEASGRAVSVEYVVGPGSATPGTEFRAKSGTLLFPAGARRRRIFVWTKGDRVDETDEDFFIELRGAVNSTVATSRVRGTIVDDDPRTP
jgi:glucose/arabinose dehydrogenase